MAVDKYNWLYRYGTYALLYVTPRGHTVTPFSYRSSS